MEDITAALASRRVGKAATIIAEVHRSSLLIDPTHMREIIATVVHSVVRDNPFAVVVLREAMEILRRSPVASSDEQMGAYRNCLRDIIIFHRQRNDHAKALHVFSTSLSRSPPGLDCAKLALASFFDYHATRSIATFSRRLDRFLTEVTDAGGVNKADLMEPLIYQLGRRIAHNTGSVRTIMVRSWISIIGSALKMKQGGNGRRFSSTREAGPGSRKLGISLGERSSVSLMLTATESMLFVIESVLHRKLAASKETATERDAEWKTISSLVWPIVDSLVPGVGTADIQLEVSGSGAEVRHPFSSRAARILNQYAVLRYICDHEAPAGPKRPLRWSRPPTAFDFRRAAVIVGRTSNPLLILALLKQSHPRVVIQRVTDKGRFTEGWTHAINGLLRAGRWADTFSGLQILHAHIGSVADFPGLRHDILGPVPQFQIVQACLSAITSSSDNPDWVLMVNLLLYFQTLSIPLHSCSRKLLAKHKPSAQISIFLNSLESGQI